MQHAAQESAMTEVALALAMGFFSLMVLTLISMGVESNGAADSADANEQRQQVAALDLAVPAATGSTAALQPRDNDVFVVFDGARFLDADLKPLDPQALARAATAQSRRVILAIDPTLSFQQALALREVLKTPRLVVTGLTPDWQARLAREAGGEDAK